MEDSDNGSVRSEKEEAEDEDLVCLDADVCNKLSGVKKTLLPFLDEASDGMKRMLDNKKKDKWGPVIATRRSSRNHGDVNVMEKAKEYQRRKNLDVPPYFKGNSFAVLQNDSLVSASDAVDIVIGQNDSQQNEIINLLIDKELVLNHDFAIKNPEEVLPPFDDLCADAQLPVNSSGVNSLYGQGGSQVCDQLTDPESGISKTPWTLVCSKKHKNKNNDRKFMEC
jgi:hypothetical protein